MPSRLHARPEMHGGLKRGRTSTSFPAVFPGVGGPGPGLSPDRPMEPPCGQRGQHPGRAELCPSNPE
eukprot:9684176-Alexandrium_andersonii.AAC.1